MMITSLNFEWITSFFKRIKENEVTARAAQLSYFLILSIFPFLIFLITLLEYTALTQQETLSQLSLLLPETAFVIVEEVINEITAADHVTLLSLGFLGTIWSASRGTYAIIQSINKAYDIDENRSFLQINTLSIAAVAALALMIFFSLALLIFGRVIGEAVFARFGLEQFFYFLWTYLRYLIPVLFVFIALCFLYKYAPSVSLSLRSVYPGAVIATTGWILTSQVFAYYVNNFGNFSRTYGSIGGIIVFLIWLYLSSVVVLSGGEINASSYRYIKKRGKTTYIN